LNNNNKKKKKKKKYACRSVGCTSSVVTSINLTVPEPDFLVMVIRFWEESDLKTSENQTDMLGVEQPCLRETGGL
jgi:hypothetical protein